LAMRRARHTLSNEFIERLFRFTSWKPGWNGEGSEPIPPDVATHAYHIAEESVAELGLEPFVAPAPDGSVLLRWTVPNAGPVIELFVDTSPDLESLALMVEDETREIIVHSDKDVIGFLQTLDGVPARRR
jgi:hypothetical protein